MLQMLSATEIYILLYRKVITFVYIKLLVYFYRSINLEFHENSFPSKNPLHDISFGYSLPAIIFLFYLQNEKFFLEH